MRKVTNWLGCTWRDILKAVAFILCAILFFAAVVSRDVWFIILTALAVIVTYINVVKTTIEQDMED